MRTIKLTNEQASTLVMFLLMTTRYRKNELDACNSLAKEKNDDGSVKFKNMESNAQWWEKAIQQIEEIKNAVDNAPYSE